MVLPYFSLILQTLLTSRKFIPGVMRPRQRNSCGGKVDWGNSELIILNMVKTESISSQVKLEYWSIPWQSKIWSFYICAWQSISKRVFYPGTTGALKNVVQEIYFNSSQNDRNWDARRTRMMQTLTFSWLSSFTTADKYRFNCSSPFSVVHWPIALHLNQH